MTIRQHLPFGRGHVLLELIPVDLQHGKGLAILGNGRHLLFQDALYLPILGRQSTDLLISHPHGRYRFLPLFDKLLPLSVLCLEGIGDPIQLHLIRHGLLGFVIEERSLLDGLLGEIFDRQRQLLYLGLICPGISLQGQIILLLPCRRCRPLLEFFLIPIQGLLELVGLLLGRIDLGSHCLDVMFVGGGLLGGTLDFSSHLVVLPLGQRQQVFLGLDLLLLGRHEAVGIRHLLTDLVQMVLHHFYPVSMCTDGPFGVLPKQFQPLRLFVEGAVGCVGKTWEGIVAFIAGRGGVGSW
mmetsp:Transcript_31443/g.92185  ORF Transcript_31443/g.92185 Transcript_31443/m.92185 type:complete len:296 (+) Transcript_31443:1530-2417(+)